MSGRKNSELQRVLGQFGVLAAALEPGVSDVAVAGMPVRVNVHTAESLAEPPAPPAVPEEPVAAAPDGQLSLFDAPPVVVAPAVDLPAPLEPLPAPAPHVPRALSYSALALHDRCGFSYYAQRVVGLRPPLAEAGPLRGALLGDALHRAVAVGVEVACAGLEPADRATVEALLAAWEGSSLAARMAVAGTVLHELPFAFVEDDVVLRGSLDICARSPDGSLLVADLKTTNLAGREPAAVVESEYALQRSIYALAALRSGAPAAEIAFCFLERPEAPVTRRFAPEDADGLAAEVRAAIGRLRASEFTARAGDHCATVPRSTACARLPAGMGGRPDEPPQRVLAAPEPRTGDPAASPRRLPRGALLARLQDALGVARRDDPLGAMHRRARQHGDAGLFARYPDPQAYADADEGEIAKAIFQTGFHNQKARSLRGAALAVLERHGGKVPRSTEQLVRLPGVGRKTAAVVSGNAFGRREGIAVDTHVGRLSRRLGLTRGDRSREGRARPHGDRPAAGLGRVLAPPDLARPRRLHLARAALPGVRSAGSVSRGPDPCATAPRAAHCVTDRARTPALAWLAWTGLISSSTQTASLATRRVWPTNSPRPACA